MDIVTTRLANQKLTGKKLSKPGDVVAWLGAVQSQDFPAAMYSLGIRMEAPAIDAIEQAFNEGKFLRTHVMRPTWHFVLPEDILWMQELTSKRVKASMAGYNRKLELTDKVLDKATRIIVKSLEGGNYLTRLHFKYELENAGIKTDVQRLAHIVFWPELEGMICSGPKVGKQLTYALVSERAPQAKRLSREEALANLTLKYFTSHGPAQLKDYAWWSGLSKKEILEGLDYNRGKLFSREVDGKEYWHSDHHDPVPVKKAHLLSIYDEYTIAYKDRSAYSGERYIERMLSLGNALTAVIIINGEVAGNWKRAVKKDKIELSLYLYRKLNKSENTLLDEAVGEYGRFLKLPVIASRI